MAMVQKTYWGLPWWDQKIVLLTFFVRGGSGFERGETYFVEGNRESGRLTRTLPIFEIHCTRTDFLKDSEIDLRVLREGAPKNSIRIMGYTFRQTSGQWPDRPKKDKVGITTPSGEMVISSDEQGLYDLVGLPSGFYAVHEVDPETGPYLSYPICEWNLKAGDVRECDVHVPFRVAAHN